MSLTSFLSGVFTQAADVGSILCTVSRRKVLESLISCKRKWHYKQSIYLSPKKKKGKGTVEYYHFSKRTRIFFFS